MLGWGLASYLPPAPVCQFHNVPAVAPPRYWPEVIRSRSLPCNLLRARSRVRIHSAAAGTAKGAPATDAAASPAPGRKVSRAFESAQKLGAEVQLSSAFEDVSDAAASKPASSSISSGVRLENICMTFKNQTVLKDCSWEVKKGQRVGLVGVNGAGKTTQLQIVMGRLQPDSGQVVRAKRNMRVAYLAQEFDLHPERTVREEFYSVYGEQMRLMRRQEEITGELEQVGEDLERMQVLLDEMESLNNKALDLDVSLLDAKIDAMMRAVGFKAEDSDRRVASFSGGWQMRVCLGKMMLQEPDLLLLDEPTNHLDLDAVQWLEGYLKGQEVPMVVVSHDREFLDQLCNKIVETERGVTTSYPGNYTQYVRAKTERVALQWMAWERQQKEITRHQELVQRLSGGAQAGRATQAERALERMRAEGLIEKPFVAKRRPFTFPPVENMGQKVVTLRGVTHGYGGRVLFQDVDLDIGKGERVALIGPNGAGKSTLLRLIMGVEQPASGRAALGEHHITANYFEQNQAEALDLNLTVLDTLVQAAPEVPLPDLKSLLGRMAFSTPALMDRRVGVLSGGEKARLALAKFMCTKGTLLVLDEPTNHLDIPSKEALEEAVRGFGGTVIAASHDRYFLRRIATRVIQIQDRQLVDFGGDYEHYLAHNEDEAKKMEAKEERAKAIVRDNTKARSKMTRAQRELEKRDKAKAPQGSQDAKKSKGGKRG